MVEGTTRPADRFFAKLTPRLQALGVSTVAPRREWPAEVLRRTLLDLIGETPRDLLSQELWAQSLDSSEWWLKTQARSQSPPTSPRHASPRLTTPHLVLTSRDLRHSRARRR